MAGKAESVTLVGRTSYPLERSLGPEIGKLVLGLHEAKGVRYVANATVASIEGIDSAVAAVQVDCLDEAIAADVVVVGIGVVPSTKYLHQSEVQLDQQGNVEVDEHLETSVKDIFAAGDIARFPLTIHNQTKKLNIGHWQIAQSHGRVSYLEHLLRG